MNIPSSSIEGSTQAATWPQRISAAVVSRPPSVCRAHTCELHLLQAKTRREGVDEPNRIIFGDIITKSAGIVRYKVMVKGSFKGKQFIPHWSTEVRVDGLARR